MLGAGQIGGEVDLVQGTGRVAEVVLPPQRLRQRLRDVGTAPTNRTVVTTDAIGSAASRIYRVATP